MLENEIRARTSSFVCFAVRCSSGISSRATGPAPYDLTILLVGWPRIRIKGCWKNVWVSPWFRQTGDLFEPWLVLPFPFYIHVDDDVTRRAFGELRHWCGVVGRSKSRPESRGVQKTSRGLRRYVLFSPPLSRNDGCLDFSPRSRIDGFSSDQYHHQVTMN